MNLTFLARQITNVVATTAAHITDDRVFFGMQLARRLPGPVSRLVGRALGRLPGDATRASSAWLLGQEAIAENLVVGSQSPSRLLGEIALNLGLLDEAETIAEAVPRATALSSRIRWTKGDIDGAIAVLPAGARRTRLIEERRSLQPGWWPETDSHITARPVRGTKPGSLPAALHVLTNSLPHTRSGYAYRSHAILTTLKDAGHEVAAATRPSYPVTIGRVSSGPVETVDGVDYLRQIPLRPLSTPTARLDDQASWLAAQAQNRDAQILHTTTHYVNGLATGAAARAVGLPWVYEVRGVLEETWAAAGSSPEEREARRASQRFKLMRAKEIEVASSADAVITLGETMRDHLIAGGVPENSITLIPNSVSSTLTLLAPPPMYGSAWVCPRQESGWGPLPRSSVTKDSTTSLMLSSSPEVTESTSDCSSPVTVLPCPLCVSVRESWANTRSLQDVSPRQRRSSTSSRSTLSLSLGRTSQCAVSSPRSSPSKPWGWPDRSSSPTCLLCGNSCRRRQECA